MNNRFLFLAIIVFALSCKHTDKFWDISEFNMKPTALKDDEPIKLIYTSQGPDYNRNVDYYIHVLVISL